MILSVWSTVKLEGLSGCLRGRKLVRVSYGCTIIVGYIISHDAARLLLCLRLPNAWYDIIVYVTVLLAVCRCCVYTVRTTKHRGCLAC